MPAPSGPHAERPPRASEAARPVALHTHSHTFVFSRLQHHTHRTQLRRAWCEGLHGAPAAEPNTAFYGELDARLHAQHATLAALRERDRGAAAAAGGLQGGGSGAGGDTVALRQAVNSSLHTQMAFFTACMERYACGPQPACPCACACGAGSHAAPAALA